MDEVDWDKIAVEDRRSALDAAFQTGKWFISSLFLLHGAALLALLNNANLSRPTAIAAAHEFGGGLIATLGAAGSALTAALAIVARAFADLKKWTWLAVAAVIVQVVATIGGFAFAAGAIASFTTGVLAVTNGFEHTERPTAQSNDQLRRALP